MVKLLSDFAEALTVQLHCVVVVCCVLQLTKNTTPMYRAPEMLDLYQNYPVNEQSDIWVTTVMLYS